MNSAVKDLTREELERKVQQLEVYNMQLKNLLQKSVYCNSSIKKTSDSKPFDFSKHSKRHILLKFCYLGWDLHGYAVQEVAKPTVESKLFDALLKLKLIESRETSDYHRCGRTDKGVSASAQVISITVRSSLKKDTIERLNNNEQHSSALNGLEMEEAELNYCKMLNSVLSQDIRILAWSPATENFSARFNCVSRTYKYFFPLANLELERMQQAAQYLIGEHDFRNFCKMDVGNGVTNFHRKITSITINQIYPNVETCFSSDSVTTKDDSSLTMESDYPSFSRGYNICSATIKGTAFLWHQIRAIMTVLILVAERKEEPEIVQKLLDVNTFPRKPQYGLASEVGLNLYDTEYENVDWIYDHHNLQQVISQLQQQWSNYAIKSAMLQHMLEDLSITFCRSNQFQSFRLPTFQARACLLEPKSKLYKPLLERQTCESLNDRVKHYIKKRRLDEGVLEKILNNPSHNQLQEPNK